MTKKTADSFLRHLNHSKKRDPRFWREGRALGLVADVNLTHDGDGPVTHFRTREGRYVTSAEVLDYAARHGYRPATPMDLLKPPSNVSHVPPDCLVASIPLYRFERGQLELEFERTWKPRDRFYAVPHFGE